MTYQKGFDLLIEVANLLKQKGANFEWIILGEGEDRKQLEEKVRSYQLENFVEFLGRVKNVDEYYKKCKFFVLTSRFEGLGIVLLEAKSYKLPIISFDCDCGPNEMITDNVNGYLVPLFNVELMADKIFSLLNDNEKCQDMSKNSFIEMKNFDEKVIIEKWNLLFEKLLGVRK